MPLEKEDRGSLALILSYEETVGSPQFATWRKAFIIYICQHLDLGLPSLQNHKK
jgi:hypothetical protein